MLDKKEKIINKMLKSGANHKKLFNEFGFAISMDISKAISPVSAITAPITIAYLEGYAKSLRDKFPDSIPLADEFKKANTILIEKEVK